MTSEEYAAIIGAEFDALGLTSPSARLLEAMARARVVSVGREYSDAVDAQGFERRAPRELIEEVEQEIADAAAWAVALSIRMSKMDCPIWITGFLRALVDLTGESTGLRMQVKALEAARVKR